jgi:hypothetical protein
MIMVAKRATVDARILVGGEETRTIAEGAQLPASLAKNPH